MRTDGQRWQDMMVRLCEMPCEAKSQHAQGRQHRGEYEMIYQSKVRGYRAIISLFDGRLAVVNCVDGSSIIDDSSWVLV